MPILKAQKFTVSGYIEDAESSERLLGASVYSSKLQDLGTASNDYGCYSLTLPAAPTKT